jgi:hypothetical protein
MSFLSDLFKGNFGSLGTDITHAPESFINHPTDMLETAGGALALAAPFAIPELGAAIGGAGSSIGGLFGGGADAAAGGDLLAFSGDAASGGGSSASSAIDALVNPGANPYDSIYGATFPNSNMVDANAFSSGNQLAGVGGSTPDATSFGGFGKGAGDLTSLADTSGAVGGDATAGDPTSFGGTGKGGDASGTSFIDKLMSGVKNAPGSAVDQLAKNPLGIAAAGVGLGYNMLSGQKQLPEQKALTGQAQTLSTQGQQFMNYLQTGTLPAGLQAAVNQAQAAAKARIIANHAANGENTDPTHNSMLAQELAQADQNALIAVAQEGEKLFTAGANEVGLSSQIYERLMQIDQQQTQNMGRAIASFASALGSGASAAKAA